MTYARRFIDVKFSGAGTSGPFTQGGGTSGDLSFTGRGKYALRTTARITHAGGFNYGTLSLELRGLSLEHIKQLSTYGRYYMSPDTTYQIQVDAGDDINGMSTVFQGSVRQAWGDMRAMPDVPFRVLANMNMGVGASTNVSSQTIKPSSYEGPTPVVQMLQQLAQQSGLKFENNGVNVKLSDPYHWGSPWKQIKEIMDAAGIYGTIDNGTLTVWPKGGSRAGDDNLFISPGTGLRDYPAFTEYGVQVRSEFKRAIKYGSNMTIQSDMTPANGTWQIIRIDYDLQANTPKGNWFVILDGSKLGAPVTML